MTRDEIQTKVLKIISVKSGKEAQLNYLLLQDVGLDSIGLNDLIYELENAFKINIPLEDIEQIKTVKDAIDYIEKNVKK